VAFGIAALDWSVTVPLIMPVGACAKTTRVDAKKRRQNINADAWFH
jgi:hypothetical protein